MIRRHKFCAAAAALGALGMLAAPTGHALPPFPQTPGTGCTFPSDGFVVNRDDGTMLVVSSQSGGVALGPRGTLDASGDRIQGNISRGAINGNKISFFIDYDGGPNVRKSESYTGDIFEDGSVSGDAYNYVDMKVHWTSPRGAVSCTN
jgi:hypothetical protein